MAKEIVNTFSDELFEIYNRPNGFCKKGTQNGWPYCETETGVRVFQKAAEPHIGGKQISTTPGLSSSSPTSTGQNAANLKTARAIGIGALLVVCCTLTLAWLAQRQALGKVRQENQEPEVARNWRETAQQLVQNLLAEFHSLKTNQLAFGAGQSQIGTGVITIIHTNAHLAALAASQISATRGLVNAHVALAQDTTNLFISLRQSLQQGIADAGNQGRAETAKLQAQITELLASQKSLLARLAVATNTPNLTLNLPGVQTRSYENSVVLIFDDGLFAHGTHFKRDAELRLQTVAKALAQVPMPLRIEVIGCADDDRIFRTWTAQFEESLALERASAVVSYFIKLGLFSPRNLAAISSGVANRPFPSDSLPNRARNRTALLRVVLEDRPSLQLRDHSLALR